jgi:hypothetical protein
VERWRPIALKCPDVDLPLRNEIDDIIQKFRTPDKQAAAFEEMRAAQPNSIRLATLEAFRELGDGQSRKYDCFTFALGLIDSPERIAAETYAPRSRGPMKWPGIDDALPGSRFLNFLQLPELPEQPSLQSYRDGDLVVYRDKFESTEHVGKVAAGVVVSKWGMKGSLWQHGLWEVPSSYGTSVRFYSPRPVEYVRRRWLGYLELLARQVSGFTSLVSVMLENKGRNLNSEELLKLADNRAAELIRRRSVTRPRPALEGS